MKRMYRDTLKELGVLAIYLFGSQAESTSTNMSDIDIGVVVKDPRQLDDSQALYNALFIELPQIITQKHTGEFDIVFLQKAPIPLQYNAITDGRLLFEADPVQRADYEQRVVDQYLDFKPILEYFDDISLKRYAL